jgi:glycosyltransferase involved in cell wall biosynthesis
MRVLHVVATAQRRGAELFASDLIRTLNGDGVDQRVAVLRDPGMDDGHYEAPTDLLASGRVVPGARVDVGSVRGLRSSIRRFRPDVVQAHGGEALKHLALATAGTGAPVVYRRIAEAAPAIRTGPRRSLYAGMMRRSAHVVAVAESIRRETIRVFGIAPDRVTTIPRGIDATRLEPGRGRDATRRELGGAADAPVILSLGALGPEKDPLAQLSVLELVHRDRPDAVHVFAGEGPMRGEIEREVRRRGLGDRVRLLGTRRDVGDLLAAGDVMILASPSEGMPGCLIEAGMAGMPVVAYAVSGVPEVVVDGETGLLAPPGDPEALACSIVELLADPARRAAMGEAARLRCRAFDIRVVAPRFLDVYRRAAA